MISNERPNKTANRPKPTNQKTNTTQTTANQSTREAKEVCKGCVVRGDCLEYALANGEKFGIWGGLSERERRRLRRQRAQDGRRVIING